MPDRSKKKQESQPPPETPLTEKFKSTIVAAIQREYANDAKAIRVVTSHAKFPGWQRINITVDNGPEK